MSSIFSYRLFIIYFFVYRVINIRIIIVINYYNLKLLNILRFKNLSLFYFLILGFIFISLAGLPPFLGFYPKIVVISAGIHCSCFFVVFILMAGSLINIFYYLNIFFNLYLSSYFIEVGLLNTRRILISQFSKLFIGILATLTIGIFYIFILYAMVLFYKS